MPNSLNFRRIKLAHQDFKIVDHKTAKNFYCMNYIYLIATPYFERTDVDYLYAEKFDINNQLRDIKINMKKESTISYENSNEKNNHTYLENLIELEAIKYIDSSASDRVFMTTLLKHTGIALAIIVPLAAYTAMA